MNEDEDRAADEALLELLKKHVKELMHHFDSVQIVCTQHWPDREATLKLNHGAGNVFARIGSVEQWLDDVTKVDIGGEA